MKKNIYNLSAREVLDRFKSSLKGLTDAEASGRLRQYGPNALRERNTRWRWAKLALAQLNDALVWILLAAASLAFFFHEYRDVVIILFIVAINAIIGFFQEYKAERILESMRRFAKDSAIVVRNGEKKEIDVRGIVPGDVVFLTSGDNAPADGLIFESYSLKVNSFIFTGESKPEEKSAKALKDADVPLADIDNMVFSGETIVDGEAKFMVTATGMATELGRIAVLAQEVAEDPTPLQMQMRRLGKNVTLLSLLIGAVVVGFGQYFGMSLYQNFLFALALAVSVVPEGLPAAISVSLSLGMKRLLKDGVLAKKLNAVETLGSVSIICTDKTGTITKNQLTVTKVVVNGRLLTVSGVGYDPKGNYLFHGDVVKPDSVENLGLLCKIATLCNDADLVRQDGKYAIVGDPTEGALVVAAKKFNASEGFFEEGETKIAEIPFSSDRMRMSVAFKKEKAVSYVKGSPDVLLRLCTRKKVGGVVSSFTKKDREDAIAVYDEMSDNALRVLAFAYRDLEGVKREDYEGEMEKNLIWVGMMAMIDPPREDVARAVARCRELGIKVVMITGDYEVTARAIARNIGLVNEKPYEIISGKALAKLSDREIYKRVREMDVVFARIAPDQKLRIADILKRNGEIIAMTGDGVNDAPAIKRADIGVAMGVIGTDVSKEASDMILLDDNFASIVKGIKEGRVIFQNLKKFVHYVFTSNASELFTVVIGVLLQISTPLTAIQILATDLGTDLFPSFSLSLEPEEPIAKADGKKGMANSKESVMGPKGFWRVVSLGLIMASGAVAAFFLSMLRGGWMYGDAIDIRSVLYLQSTTAAYAVISMTQMANLFQSRSETLSPFRLGFFRNKYALGAIGISVSLLLVFIHTPVLQDYLGLRPILYQDWSFVVFMVAVVFLFEEWRKRMSARSIRR